MVIIIITVWLQMKEMPLYPHSIAKTEQVIEEAMKQPSQLSEYTSTVAFWGNDMGRKLNSHWINTKNGLI